MVPGGFFIVPAALILKKREVNFGHNSCVVLSSTRGESEPVHGVRGHPRNLTQE